MSSLNVMNHINIIWINVRGLCGQAKRTAFYQYVQEKQFDVTLIQETHMCDDHLIHRAKKQWLGTSYWIKGEPNSTGVAILFRKRFDVLVQNEIDGRDGRFLRLDCLIMGFKLSIVNVYMQNDAVKRNEFIDNLTMRLNMSNHFILYVVILTFLLISIYVRLIFISHIAVNARITPLRCEPLTV
jgi:exonuclease III